MAEEIMDESLLEMFIFETNQNIEQLEQLILENEQSEGFSAQLVNEIFRIMHTIKGSAAMMGLNSLSKLAHSVEDLFSFIRTQEQTQFPQAEDITDLVLKSIDFIKDKLEQIQTGETPSETDGMDLRDQILDLLKTMKGEDGQSIPEKSKDNSVENTKKSGAPKQEEHTYKNKFKAEFHLEKDCQMECLRACNIVCNLGEKAGNIICDPADIMDNDNSIEIVRNKGVQISFDSDMDCDEMSSFLSGMPFLCDLKLQKLRDEKTLEKSQPSEDKLSKKETAVKKGSKAPAHLNNNSMMSVHVAKVDKLMDLMGELVISEAMVIHNPELKKLSLEGFQKSTRHLKQITNEIRDVVMSLRMVDLNPTFQKMNRIVRDMCKKLNKHVELKMIGADTLVDKSIVEHISDPLMHLVRNSIDHGIESPEERLAKGKPEIGTVTLEAKQEGNHVLVLVKDDGQGLDREKILNRAKEKGLLKKPVEKMTDREVNMLIFLPGFSTNDNVTEYSGRGVGMDVVVKNIETVGGKVTVDSEKDHGCVNIMKFPLTLAIIEGMNLRVGKSIYTIPITDMVQSFRPKPEQVIIDPDMHEMLMIKGNVYPVVRLHEFFGIQSDVKDLDKGIIIMAVSGEEVFCIFADELIGQQEVVVKTIPEYVKRSESFSGCTLLGDGQISLILNTASLLPN